MISQNVDHFSTAGDIRTWCLAAGLVLNLPVLLLGAAESPEEPARRAAVALNYCRASFHRIQRNPTKRVLVEEQEKILNNLNLNGIADAEVVKLYTAVLAEISDVQITEQELKLVRTQHKRVFRRQLVHNLFAISTQIASAQYTAAVRTGARSWWDYRSMRFQRELDTWGIEKDRMTALVDKSSLFLDTFWKLARRRSISDRWLVRSTDLDKLDEALQEPNLEIRLRVLKRMERFMECYPPYFYYLGRTQQALGQLFAAAATYEKLVDVGDGRFRKDDMLAAGLANRSVIQEYLRQPSAPATAIRALLYSTDVWEVNLACARVLMQHGRFDESEEAILRNLDVDLEYEQSLPALLTLYCQSKNKTELTDRLSRPETFRLVPIPVLLECAVVLKTNRLPQPLIDYLVSSISGHVDVRFGPDDLVLVVAPGWHMSSLRKIELTIGDKTYPAPARTQAPAWERAKAATEVRFQKIFDLGNPLKPGPSISRIKITLKPENSSVIHLHLRQRTATTERIGTVRAPRKRRPSLLAVRARSLRLCEIELKSVRFSLLSTRTAQAEGPSATSTATPSVQKSDAENDDSLPDVSETDNEEQNGARPPSGDGARPTSAESDKLAPVGAGA